MAAVNTAHIHILKKLISKGLTTKKDILELNLFTVMHLGLSKNEMLATCELMDAIKKNDIIGFFIDENAPAEKSDSNEG